MTDAPVPSAEIIDGVDVDAVSAAVTACPGVSGLFGGPGDMIASYLPGRRVPGVEVSRLKVVVSVRSRWAVTASELLKQISQAVAPALRGKHLEVVVADIDDDASGPTPQAAPAHATTEPAAVSTSASVSAPEIATPTPVTPTPAPVRTPGSSPPPSAATPRPVLAAQARQNGEV